VYTAAMGFTSDVCWFLLLKSLLIKNNKEREAAIKNEAGGDEKHVFFLLGISDFSIVTHLVMVTFAEYFHHRRPVTNSNGS